jgi:hypothetical protein
MISRRNEGGFAFLGVIIGLIIGLITDIIMGGFIATILNIDKNLEDLKNNQGQPISQNKKVSSETNNTDEKVNISKQFLKSDEKNKMKIKRLENVVGSAMLVNINIDKDIRFSLENGEEKNIDISNGKHILIATFDDNLDKREFEINNDSLEIGVIIKPPIKIVDV